MTHRAQTSVISGGVKGQHQQNISGSYVHFKQLYQLN